MTAGASLDDVCDVSAHAYFLILLYFLEGENGFPQGQTPTRFGHMSTSVDKHEEEE